MGATDLTHRASPQEAEDENLNVWEQCVETYPRTQNLPHNPPITPAADGLQRTFAGGAGETGFAPGLACWSGHLATSDQ